ncbi:unnamed protein product [Pedinophyceae sp. YPF-701]|nr:unnamed protein product [Pedinophyceae sp. YPF-701]
MKTGAMAGGALRSLHSAASRSVAARATPDTTLEGRKYLVTGATDGIGRHTARQLALRGATVLLHGRSQARVEQTIAEIAKDTGVECQGYVHDFKALAGARALADDVLRDHGSVDCLLNNAGVYLPSKEVSDDGFEMTWAVNVLAPFVLTQALVGAVSWRIVNVASLSAAHSVDFGNLNQERGYDGHNAYSLSKIANICFSNCLADRLAKAGSPVTSNSLDPGTVDTKMLRAGWSMGGIPVSTANNQLHLCTSPGVEGVSGAYYVSQRMTSPPPPATDRDTREQLWATMEEHTGVKFSL